MDQYLTLSVVDAESCRVDRGVGLEPDGHVVGGGQEGSWVSLSATEPTQNSPRPKGVWNVKTIVFL